MCLGMWLQKDQWGDMWKWFPKSSSVVWLKWTQRRSLSWILLMPKKIYHEEIRTKSQEEGGCHWKHVCFFAVGRVWQQRDSRRRLIMEVAPVRLGMVCHNLESSRWICYSFKGILWLRVRWKNVRAPFRNWLHVPFQSHWHFFVFPIWEAAWNKD